MGLGARYCRSVAQSCQNLCDLMDCSTPGLPVLHHLPEFAQTHVHRVGDAIQPPHPLRPLVLLPSIFPTIRVFSSQSALCIRWSKYWSFSNTPCSEYSGLISFRIDGFDLFTVQGTLQGYLLPPNKHTETSVQFSRSVISNCLPPHGLQHTRLPCPSPTPAICSSSCQSI